MDALRFSICTTNYNCAHALKQHLDSIYSLFSEDEFEYIVVDNKSKDDSYNILKDFQSEHNNMIVLSQRCSMGWGRQIAFTHSKGNHIVIIDTDTVYLPRTKDFIEICLSKYPDLAVQALYCAVFPRDVWERVGGRRDMNVKEDVDMWMRIWKIDKMKWYPVIMGDNIKSGEASGGGDHLSKRYGKMEKFQRLTRREIDHFKARWYKKHDFLTIYQENIIDLGLGPHEKWFFDVSRRPWLVRVGIDVIRILQS